MARRQDKFRIDTPPMDVFTTPPPDLGYLGAFRSPNVPITPTPIRNDIGGIPNIAMQEPSLSEANPPNEFVGPTQGSTLERLRGLYGNPPTMEGNKPRLLRRIGGAIVGGMTGAAFGPEVGVTQARNIVEKPYREAYQDWVIRTGALKQQADLERQEAELENERTRLGYSGLSSMASLLRAQTAGDPELQGEIAGSRETAIQNVRAPLEEKKRADEQAGREALEDIRRDRAITVEQMRIQGRKDLSEAERKSREDIAKKQIQSRENIARLSRALRSKIAASRNQRVPPSQQYLAKLMAENEISQLISDKDEFDALFNETEDNQGRPVITMKSDKDVPAKWKMKYDERKKQASTIMKGILGSSFNPTSEEEEEFNIEDEEDLFDIEEVD